MYYYLRSSERWYEVRLSYNLFNELCCERSWGSLSNRKGSNLIKYFKTTAEAEKELLTLVKVKQRKGYNIIVAD